MPRVIAPPASFVERFETTVAEYQDAAQRESSRQQAEREELQRRYAMILREQDPDLVDELLDVAERLGLGPGRAKQDAQLVAQVAALKEIVPTIPARQAEVEAKAAELREWRESFNAESAKRLTAMNLAELEYTRAQDAARELSRIVASRPDLFGESN